MLLATEEDSMPRGDKSKYTDKQKRQAEHIEESEKKEGRSAKAAARIAWATVNKQDGGGQKSGSGRKKASTRKKSSRSRSS
jgi:plasmid stabilization system protein ParE